MSFTIEALNARFAGKTVRIIYDLQLPNSGTKSFDNRVIKTFRSSGYEEDPDAVDVVFEDGSHWVFIPDTMTSDSIEGHICHNISCRRKFQIIASLKQVAEEKAALEAKAKKIWNDLAEELSSRIPESCMEFAREKAWVKLEPDGHWRFPEWLGFLISNAEHGGCCDFGIMSEHLVRYGFSSFEDIETKMTELGEAWKNIIRVEVEFARGNNDTIWRAVLCFYAIEYESKK